MRFCFIGIWCVLVALQFAACKTTAKTMGTDDAGNNKTTKNADAQADANSTTDTSATRQGKRTSEILSVIVNVKKEESGVVVWTIGSASLKSGRFKHNFANVTPDYLKAYFTDDAGYILDSSLFAHPLKRQLESPGTQGQLTTTEVALLQGTAYLRADNNTAISMLSIYGPDNTLIVSFHLKDYLK